MRFEVGKCYIHNSGKVMRILCEVNTHYYGHCFIGETDDGRFIPVGMESEFTINWKVCDDKESE